MAVLVTPGRSLIALGRAPRLNSGLVLLFAFLGALGLVILGYTHRSRRRWWERQPLVTTGSGTLADAYASATVVEPG